MYQAEQEHLLAEEQYGSHKYKSAIHQCLNKQLFYDLVHFKWQPAALCSNDAKSCYDWITLLATALCLCQCGGSQPMISSMITTLHEMQHHIWTTFGDSAAHASRETWKSPIAGIGQGNRAGPHIWAVVSSPMLGLMCQARFYANLMAAISLKENHLVGFAFVDDTDLCVYGPQVNHPMCQLPCKMQLIIGKASSEPLVEP